MVKGSEDVGFCFIVEFRLCAFAFCENIAPL